MSHLLRKMAFIHPKSQWTETKPTQRSSRYKTAVNLKLSKVKMTRAAL